MFTKLQTLFYKFAPAWAVNLALKFKLTTLERRRVEEVAHWIGCAHKLAQETGHVHAKEIVAFLRAEGFAVNPEPGGFKAIQAKPRMRLPMTVLLPEDKEVGGIWQSQFDMSDGHMANFVRDAGGTFAMLALKGHVKTSDFSKGLLCLHEGKHAWHFFHKPHRNKAEQLDEELQVLEFECRLIELRFGGMYADFISEEVERIAKLSKGGKTPIKQEWFVETLNEFAKRFQQPVDEVEKALFTTILWYAVMFRFLEKYGSGDSRANKIHFVQHVDNRPSRK